MTIAPTRPTRAQHTSIAAPALLDPCDLAALDERAFAVELGRINTTFMAADAAYQSARENKISALTEQIVRALAPTHPDAELVFFTPVGDFHQLADQTTDPDCEGHDFHLVPTEAYTADGDLLDALPDLSPVHFLAEQAGELLGTDHSLVLEVSTREWTVDCTAA